MTFIHSRSALPLLAFLFTVLLVFLWDRDTVLFVPRYQEHLECSAPPPPEVLSLEKPASLREQVELVTEDAERDQKFPKVAVLNLASRPDRRKHMEVLGEVHSLDLTFVDATPSSSPEIIWLQERMYDDSRNTSWKSNKTENESWKLHYLTTPPSELLPPPSSTLHPNASSLLNFPQAVRGVESLPGPLACFVSHLNLLRRIVAEDWGTTIVLEDDIDLEWRFTDIWREIVGRSIPKELEWHLLYLGYSFSTEDRFRPVHHPGLRPTSSPLGTYSYAVSQQGAAALLTFLSQPENFVALPIDHIYRRFNSLDQVQHQNKFEARQVLSCVPPLSAHGGQRNFGSDIGGTSNIYQTKLADSTMDRLERFYQVQEEKKRERVLERPGRAGVGASSE